jgi:alcohol dehydrogenase class IV
MNLGFEFATATRVVFGAGVLNNVGALARDFGRHALVVTGREPRRAQPLLDRLQEQHLAATVYPVAGEPTLQAVEKGTALAHETGADFVIGIGGGSALDAGKAIAALLANDGDLLDYVEVIGCGRTLAQAPVPYLAIPTTAGTGTEVTRNAVLAAPAHRVKVSLRSPLLLPRLALVDPELTFGLPPALTAATGLDALTQLIEPFVSGRSNPITDALCREGLPRVARSLRRAFVQGTDAAARADLALASLLSGMALANAGLGAVHGFAAPIGGRFHAPHGAVCAALLPHVMAANLHALRARAPESAALARYREVAALLTGHAQAAADDGVRWVSALVQDLAIPGLISYGLGLDDVEALVEQAGQASSMKGNPIALTRQELAATLQAAL